MRDLQIETHVLLESELPQALAFHMLATCLNGSIAVVCEKPKELMLQVKQEWLHLTKNKASHYRENISFSAASPFDDTQASITFSTVKEYKLLPPICRTLYITQEVDRQDMYMLTSWMQPHAMLILYKTN
jgi:hypothetical protein